MSNSLLKGLGVKSDTLSKEEIQFLDQNGYLNLGKLLSEAELDAILCKISRIQEKEGEDAGFELFDSPYIKHPKEAGADRLADLVNKGSEFDIFYTHPRVLAAMYHVLGEEFKLSSLNYRAAKAGKGLQKLHVDWHEAVEPDNYKVCNSIWLLDDFSIANGATRIVPGSHLWGKTPQENMSDPFQPHPDEIIIEAEAGSVFIFNSHSWHGGTNNASNKSRRAVHSYFCGKGMPQQLDQQKYILRETLDRLPKGSHEILGVEA
ncbi:MAG: phytanoyl-CoA dioxygenase family protein [Bacteroidota bacterium]